MRRKICAIIFVTLCRIYKVIKNKSKLRIYSRRIQNLIIANNLKKWTCSMKISKINIITAKLNLKERQLLTKVYSIGIMESLEKKTFNLYDIL